MADSPAADDPSGDAEALLHQAVGDWTLDPAGSAVEFHVKHFWGAITVHGHFEKIEGEGTVNEDGSVAGQLRIDAGSLTTKNGRRDKHLRSADFFDVEKHPVVTVRIEGLVPEGPGRFRGQLSLEAAGRQQDLQPTIEVVDATSEAVTLRTDALIDRTAHDMTWGPLGMTSHQARVEVTARFVKR